LNIFSLHKDPVICAQYHVDRHVVKMIIEYAQLLSTAHHKLGTCYTEGEIYRPISNPGHGACVWTCQASGNYEYVHALLMALLDEYTFRYGKIHKVRHDGMARRLATLPDNIKRGPMTGQILTMPDDCKGPGVISSYRRLYATHKQHLLRWTSRPMPPFLEQFGFVAETVNKK
jgi:hypothetical protein